MSAFMKRKLLHISESAEWKQTRQTHLNHVSNWCFAFHIPSEILLFSFFLWFYKVKVLETHLAYSSSFRARLWCSQDLLLLSGVELHFIVAAIKGALVRLAALSRRKLPTMDLQPVLRPPFKNSPDSLKKKKKAAFSFLRNSSVMPQFERDHLLFLHLWCLSSSAFFLFSTSERV